MSRRWTGFAAVVLVLGLGHLAGAHDGHEGAHLHKGGRTWTNASGYFHVVGSFVAVRGARVQIDDDDGERFEIGFDDLSAVDQKYLRERVDTIVDINTKPLITYVSQKGADRERMPEILASFQPFAEKIKLRWDRDYFFVESNGIPDHQMMVGITAWQQQVPLPQTYTGDNAWRIPLRPIPAKHPISAKNHFLRGAIALAPNGVPIFNPLNNRGEDSYKIGELDEFGGHCGRADDYHYHIAPVHLEKTVGKGLPIAVALDGYPIYGYDEPDGSKVQRLDAFNGHVDDQNHYHYHATRSYPYLNGGFHGEVTERGSQVDPQPRAEPLRQAMQPLQGAHITDFQSPRPGSYRLTYELRGQKNLVNYTIDPDRSVKFEYVDGRGKATSETFPRRR